MTVPKPTSDWPVGIQQVECPYSQIRSKSTALPAKIFDLSCGLIDAVWTNSTPSTLELNGQSTAKRIRSAPSSITVQRSAGCEKLPLVVTYKCWRKHSASPTFLVRLL